jgi:hypothetical protein
MDGSGSACLRGGSISRADEADEAGSESIALHITSKTFLKVKITRVYSSL